MGNSFPPTRKLLALLAVSFTLLPNAQSEGLKLGFIYVGPKDDYGYNQAHAEGSKAAAAMPGVQIEEEANVPETVAVEQTMKDMIVQDGLTVLFPTSFGYYDPHVLRVAKQFPEVQFFHCGGFYVEGKHPKNVGSFFGYIDEAQYVAGVVAGLTTKTNKLGFVGAKPVGQVLRNINSFTLGARSVNPKVSVQVAFTGDWSLPVKEAEATNGLIDQGADVITCHVDSPKVVIQTAESRGVYSSGYHASQAAIAPKGYLTGAEWDWKNVYRTYVTDVEQKKSLQAGSIPHTYRGGLKEGFVKLSPYGPAVSDATKAAADRVKAKFMDGSMVIYRGELKDNTGKVVVPAGTELKQQDPQLEKMNWLVEGVIGNPQG
jgi:basic membrane protein A and related proteins